jgi:hypothetical protein
VAEDGGVCWRLDVSRLIEILESRSIPEIRVAVDREIRTCSPLRRQLYQIGYRLHVLYDRAEYPAVSGE